MKNIRWQLIIILVAGILVGILLLSGQSGFRLVSPSPTKGGSYTEALVGGLQRLNPLLDAFNQPDRDVDRLLFSGLLRFDSRGEAQPDLAERWGISMDGLTYNFDINPKATWHDGKPVTAEDVAFTVNMLRDPASVLPEDLKSFWKGVDVIVLSERSLQFQLTEAFAPFIDYLTFGIIPKHLLGTFSYTDIVNSSFNIQPIGCGPYLFDKLIVEDGQIKGVALKVNEKYYGQVPYISQVAFRYYSSAPLAYSDYTKGAVQGLGEVSLDILPEGLNNPTLSFYSARKPQVSLILFNLKNDQVKFLQDKVIRRALLAGLNRRGMIDKAYAGQGIIASVPLLSGTWSYYDGLAPVDYDPQKAADLLKQQGYILAKTGDTMRSKEGSSLNFELLYPQDPIHQAIAESIQADWLKIGVSITLNAVAYDLLVLDHLQPLSYQAALVDFNFANSPDPDPYPFWDVSQAGNGQNYSQWENRVASEYLEQARVSQDFQERAKLYRNFQVIFMDELPALPLFYPVYNYGVDKTVRGIRMGPLFDPSDRFYTITNWFLVSK